MYRKYFVSVAVFILLCLALCSCGEKSDSWMNRVTDIESLYENGDSVYYVSEQGICRYDKNDNTDTILVEDASVTCFCFEGGTLYYCLGEEKIISCGIDGKGTEEILTFSDIRAFMVEDGIKRFTVYGGKIYIYNSGTSLIKFDPQTGTCEDFVKDCSSAAFFNGSVYYIDHAEKTQSVYVKSCDGASEAVFREFAESLKYCDVFEFNGSLYLAAHFPAALYRVSESEGDISVAVPSADYLGYCSANNELYAVKPLGEAGYASVYRLDFTSGTFVQVAELKDMYFELPFAVADKYMFYHDSGDKSVKYQLLSE